MIKIKTFRVNPLEVNCYVVSDESGEAVVIDPGCFRETEWKGIYSYINDEKLKVVHLLLTHAHFDHIMGCQWASKDLGMNPECHMNDVQLYKDLLNQTRRFLGFAPDVQDFPVVGKCMNDGEIISFGSHEIKLIHTPGHSAGSVCYYIESENTVFTGDTLFCNGMGRTDLDGGSYCDIIKSLQHLCTLPDSVKAYPGHGMTTEIGREKMWLLGN